MEQGVEETVRMRGQLKERGVNQVAATVALTEM